MFQLGRNLLIASISFLSSTLFFSAPEDELTKDVLKQTNKFRKSQGLEELEMKDKFNDIAKKHSEDMANGRRSFGHAGFNQRGNEVGKIYKYTSISENVAYGANDAKEAIDMWKNSSGHRANMLGNYKYIGIGIAKNSQGILYYTQIFVR
jgi:uncharacterized protein YkwD